MSDALQSLADRPNAYLRLADAAKLYPGTVHPSTLIRHILKGVRLQDGSILKLHARRTPGGWVTSPTAIDEFIDALTADRCGEPLAVELRASTARRREVERAERDLARRGV
jgi:hypothetical protein